MASELLPPEHDVVEQEEARQKPPEPKDPQGYLKHHKVVMNAPYSLARQAR
jgi:hypothetical protein